VIGAEHPARGRQLDRPDGAEHPARGCQLDRPDGAEHPARGCQLDRPDGAEHPARGCQLDRPPCRAAGLALVGFGHPGRGLWIVPRDQRSLSSGKCSESYSWFPVMT